MENETEWMKEFVTEKVMFGRDGKMESSGLKKSMRGGEDEEGA